MVGPFCGHGFGRISAVSRFGMLGRKREGPTPIRTSYMFGIAAQRDVGPTDSALKINRIDRFDGGTALDEVPQESADSSVVIRIGEVLETWRGGERREGKGWAGSAMSAGDGDYE